LVLQIPTPTKNADLSSPSRSRSLVVVLENDLPQDKEVRLVSREGEHDEICIQTVHDVAGVGVPPRLPTLKADVFHGLVLALSRDVGVGEDDLEVCVLVAESAPK
jgi:hypothetical protein